MRYKDFLPDWVGPDWDLDRIFIRGQKRDMQNDVIADVISLNGLGKVINQEHWFYSFPLDAVLVVCEVAA